MEPSGKSQATPFGRASRANPSMEAEPAEPTAEIPLTLTVRADARRQMMPERPRFTWQGPGQGAESSDDGRPGSRRIKALAGYSAIALTGAGMIAAAFFAFARWPLTPEWLEELANPKIDYRNVQLLEHAAFADRPASWEQVEMRLGSGETVIAALSRSGVNRTEAANLLLALTRATTKPVFRAGQKFRIFFTGENENRQIAALTTRIAPESTILLERSANGDYSSRILTLDLTRSMAFVESEIEGSLYQSARIAGASDREVDLFIDVFKYDVDFQRDIQAGDRFSIFFEKFADERGRLVKSGDAMYLALKTGKISKEFYRFTTPDDGKSDFYDAKGQSARKFLIRTPVNAARVSSGFGYRRHPVLGYTRLHKGVDFAAPTGTPIVAAAGGVVVKASWFGSYGRYVRIRHSKGFETAYAHMSGFAKNIRNGAKVSQGQRIGYVGTTGRSTGPHLHYEVLIKGAAINPNSLRPQTGRQLSGTMLAAFAAEKDRIDALKSAPGNSAPGKSAPANLAPGASGDTGQLR